jgi:hypothetical protein
MARTGHSTLFLTRTRLVLSLRRGSRDDVLAMRFAGARPARVTQQQRLPGISNYLQGADPNRWRTRVARYGAVRYAGLYPGVDLVVHGAGDARLEYDFRVAPGGDPTRIGLAFTGAQGLRIARDGGLVLALRGGDIRQPRPLAWQTVAGVRRPVEVFYSRAGGTVRLRLGPYDRARSSLTRRSSTRATGVAAATRAAARDPAPRASSTSSAAPSRPTSRTPAPSSRPKAKRTPTSHGWTAPAPTSCGPPTSAARDRTKETSWRSTRAARRTSAALPPTASPRRPGPTTPPSTAPRTAAAA